MTTPPKSPTPETDAKCEPRTDYAGIHEVVRADFARTLEQQRDEALVKLKELEQGMQQGADFCREVCMERDTLHHDLELAHAACAVNLKVCKALAEMDWCIGYELTPDQHSELDNARTDAIEALNNVPSAAKDMVERMGRMEKFVKNCITDKITFQDGSVLTKEQALSTNHQQ